MALIGVVLLGFKAFGPKQGPLGANGVPTFYNSSSLSTTTVGIYSWSTVLSADSSRTYVSLCNDSVAANSAIFLGMGATSSVSRLGMAGIRVPSGSCYELTSDKMFYGVVYGIASSSTSTLDILNAVYPQ